MKQKYDFKAKKEQIAKAYLASNPILSTEIVQIVQNHQQLQNDAFVPRALEQSQVVVPNTQPQFTQQQSNPNNTTHLLEEINSLKNFLQQKDLVIDKLYGEKQELATKLAVSESNNLSLSRESMELRADKVELRNDKSRLNEEILTLRQSDLAKAAEIEQLKKEFAEFSLLESNSLVGELQLQNTNQLNMEHNFAEQQLEQHQLLEGSGGNWQNNLVGNPLIAGDTIHSILLSQEESIVLGDSLDLNSEY
jgi:hypothetical protein